jgi:hypothetical protein
MLGEVEGLNPPFNSLREISKSGLMLMSNPVGTNGGGGTADKGWALNESGLALHVSGPNVHADGHVWGTAMQQHFRHITNSKQRPMYN